MTINIKNAAPKANLLGIQDLSGRAGVLSPEQIPQHLPHIFLFTERGTMVPQIGSGSTLIGTYGANSFDYRGPYANHQTVLANVCNGNGNAVMIQRLRPSDAPDAATIVLWVDILAEDIDQYTRDVDGDIVRDANGVPTPSGATEPGYTGLWSVAPIGVDANGKNLPLASLTSKAGTQTGGSGQSTMYPIMAIQVSNFGEWGNRVGLRLSAPTVKSTMPTNEDTILDQMAFIYRFQLVERAVGVVTPNVSQTINGTQSVEFSFKEGAVDRKVDLDLWSDKVILQSYNERVPGMPELTGPVNEMHIYHDNIADILKDIHDAEALVDTTLPTEAGAEHMINFLTGVDFLGRPYNTFRVLGPSASGALFNENTTHYAQGGGDGTITLGEFDALVGNEMANWGSLEYNFLDDAMYPQSIYYDTGFSIDTKKKMLTPIGLRKDVSVVLSTQDVTAPQNTTVDESSMAIALRSAARMYPESELYGTPVCRAVVLGHSGYLINSKYDKLLPLTLDFASKLSKYAGAADGRYKSTKKPDVSPMNQVTTFKDVNCTYKPSNVRHKDWDNGLVWCQNYDRRSLFYPAFQTVYDDDTSVLNSAMNMYIFVECQKVAQRTWRDLTGITHLTASQFIERSNKLIRERTAGRFDGRVIIEPDTFYTDNDVQRGYSWSCNINVFANNMKTVGTFTVTANRRED